MEDDFRTTPLDRDALNEHAAKNGNGDCDDCRDEQLDLAELARLPAQVRSLSREIERQHYAIMFATGVLILLVWKVTHL